MPTRGSSEVEHRAHNPTRTGSIPVLGTNFTYPLSSQDEKHPPSPWKADVVTISRSRLGKIQKAGYKCQARTPQGFQCNAPAGKVDRATGVVVCNEHLSQTSR